MKLEHVMTPCTSTLELTCSYLGMLPTFLIGFFFSPSHGKCRHSTLAISAHNLSAPSLTVTIKFEAVYYELQRH